MERVKEYDDMMAAEVADYEIGKRHLANIMGENPETFTQADVNRAIEYLLPSGVFDKKARPMMKNPYEIFPKRKAAQFGLDGRPHHWLYFTTKPQYYNILYDVNWKLEDLKAAEDEMILKKSFGHIKEENDNFKTYELARSEWLSLQQLEDKVVEKVTDKEYQHLLVLLGRLADHPLACKERDFIMTYRNPIPLQSAQIKVPDIEIDNNGRTFSRGEGTRKRCGALVRLYKPGSGKVSINGQDLSYFSNNMHREALLGPLSVAGLLDRVDIEAEVETAPVRKRVFNNFIAPRPAEYVKGPTAQSGAIRLALARALTAFLDDAGREKLRLAGLLTEDPRVKERKKPGREKARKKFTWKKR